MRIKLSCPITLSELSITVGAPIIDDSTAVTYISTDTRQLRGGDLFIALRGERFCGEDFVGEAMRCGAYTLAESCCATISVDSVELALTRLIRAYLKKLTSLCHTVAITGSVGKTTTKELLARMLRGKYVTHATEGNQNNLYGVMFTVLSAPRDTEVLILEVGMNHEGEIRRIAEATEPTVSVITNIGTAHIGNLGTRERIAGCKLELCSGKKNKITVVPHDEPLLKTAPHRFTYSTSSSTADVYFIPLRSDRYGTVFDMYSMGRCWLGKRFPICGAHLFDCFCAALSAALNLGLREGELDTALASINSEILRQKFIKVGKYLIYDDTYSASYEATVATLEMLSIYKKPIYAVLFDMLELGKDSRRLHRLVGEQLARLDVKELFAVGDFSPEIAAGALSHGMKEENIHINKNVNDLTPTLALIKSAGADGILLVKGSHKMHAERIIDFLRKEEQTC